MKTTFIFFDVLFQFMALGMLYALYKVVKECWHTFTHLDEYEYDDWEEDDDDTEFLCGCGQWITEEQSLFVHGRWVCDYCVF